MSGGKLLVYLLGRDLRVSDNPILHHLATSNDHGFTHLLPLFVFPAHQIEVSGFLKDGEQSPYPPARSQVGNFWRCGPHRAKFLSQSVADLKSSLESLDSGLLIRVGKTADVLKHFIENHKEQPVTDVWMTEEKSWEEVQEQDEIGAVCNKHGINLKLWPDEKYYIDDRDTGLSKPKDLPDVFTSYRKSQEPLRERPRQPCPTPKKKALPTFPSPQDTPAQEHPFTIPDSSKDIEERLLKPVREPVQDLPPMPDDAQSAHPFEGGETAARERLEHLIMSGSMSSYKATRNGMIGLDFSTKLSAYLALGSVTARSIHSELIKYEDGQESAYSSAPGFGKGENDGTKGVRFELLWRDYMRLCTHKFGKRLFYLAGFQLDKNYNQKWHTSDGSKAPSDQEPGPEEVAQQIERFIDGTTGMGLIDASQRELLHTGYTSNRARQNVASFLAKHLGIDWRYGAEWYESMLIDYDVSSNWANWQYVAGVGNDPRGSARIFNPVKQAFDYDKEGKYVKMWVPEVRGLRKLENVFQISTTTNEDLAKQGLIDCQMAREPLKRIEFHVGGDPKHAARKNMYRKKPYGRGGRRGWDRDHEDDDNGGVWLGGHHDNGGSGSGNGSTNGASGNGHQSGGHGGGRGGGGGGGQNRRAASGHHNGHTDGEMGSFSGENYSVKIDRVYGTQDQDPEGHRKLTGMKWSATPFSYPNGFSNGGRPKPLTINSRGGINGYWRGGYHQPGSNGADYGRGGYHNGHAEMNGASPPTFTNQQAMGNMYSMAPLSPTGDQLQNMGYGPAYSSPPQYVPAPFFMMPSNMPGNGYGPAPPQFHDQSPNSPLGPGGGPYSVHPSAQGPVPVAMAYPGLQQMAHGPQMHPAMMQMQGQMPPQQNPMGPM